MKKLLLFMLIVVPAGMRAQSATDAVTDRICDCFEKEHGDTITTRSGLQSKISDCFVRSIGNDLNKVLKECHVKKYDTEGGYAVGVELGKRMVVRCKMYQDLVMRMYGDEVDKTAATTTNPPPPAGIVQYTTGSVTKKETNGFVWVTMKDASGSETRYLWLTKVTGSVLLENGQDLTGLNVKIGWRLEDVFLPEQQTYVTVRQIVSFEAI